MAYLMKMNPKTFEYIIENNFRKYDNLAVIIEDSTSLLDKQIVIYYDPKEKEQKNIEKPLLLLKKYFFESECNFNKKVITIKLIDRKNETVLADFKNNNTSKDLQDYIEQAYSRCLLKVKFDLITKLLKYTGYDSNEQFKVLLHLIQFLKLNRIELVDSLKMFENVRSEMQKENNDNFSLKELCEDNIKQEFFVLRKVELMGCYAHKDKAIYICPEHIQHFLKQKDFEKIPLADMYYKVFAHEAGHLVFSYLEFDLHDYSNLKIIKLLEKQANYFASYVYESYYDYLISIVTSRQLKEYQNPLLISHRYTETPEVYDREVTKLYEGIYEYDN